MGIKLKNIYGRAHNAELHQHRERISLDSHSAMQSTVHQGRDEVGGIDQVKRDVDERVTERRIGRLLHGYDYGNRLDNIRLTVEQHNDTIKGDVLAGFSSLQSRLDDFKSSIETSRRGWQANFEERVHKKLHSVESVLAEILKALPVPEDNTIKQTPIIALDPHIQPLACPRHPEVNGEVPESTNVDQEDEATNLTVPLDNTRKQAPVTALNPHVQSLACPQHPEDQSLTNGEGPENTIIEQGDETTNSTVPTVVEEHLLTSSGRARSGEETCGVVQPQMANNYLHGTEQGTEELGVDVLAEHLLKGFEEDGELAECQLISIFRFTTVSSDTTSPPSMLYLPTFPPGDGLQSLQAMHTVPTHHPTRATLTCCLVAKPEHTSSSKKAQKIFVVHIGKFRSVYWTNPLFVGVKAWCYGAMFRNPPLLLPSKDHDASPLLPSLWSCSGVSCVGMPLAPAHASLGLNLLWLVLLSLAGNCQYSPPYWWSTLIPTPLGWSGRARGRRGRAGVAGLCSFQGVMGYSIRCRYQVLAALLVVNPDPDATGVVGVGKRKAGQGRSGKPVSLSRRGGIFYSLSVLRTIMPTVVAELQWGRNVNACTLHAIFTHAFAYQIIPLFLLLSHLNIAYRRVGQVNNERKQGAREQDTEVGSSGKASDRVTDRQTPNQDMDQRFVYDVRQLLDGVAEEEFD
ncbi:hypothetical protein EDB87DRAFT_1582808 [Lactarius vividus]|nr:hypothetical protein EDB87DRAFT_1582808 [Lactarius vividus]